MITKPNWAEVHSKQSYRFSNRMFSNYFIKTNRMFSNYFIKKCIFTNNKNHFRRLSSSFANYLKENFTRQLHRMALLSDCSKNYSYGKVKGCSYGGELARLGWLAHLVEILSSLRNSYKKYMFI